MSDVTNFRHAPCTYTNPRKIVMNNQLIPVFTGNNNTQLCNARDLHAYMGVGKDFSNWIKDRIEQYSFLAGSDYVTIEVLSSPKSASSKARKQAMIEYHLTLDMAKELAMVENNDQGRAVRRYFIRAEKELRAHLRDMAQHVLPIPGIKFRARDGMSFKDTLVLQVHSHNTLKELIETEQPALRYNLHCQLRQINETLGIPTQTLAEIEEGLEEELDLLLGTEKLGEMLLEKMIGKQRRK